MPLTTSEIGVPLEIPHKADIAHKTINPTTHRKLPSTFIPFLAQFSFKNIKTVATDKHAKRV